MLLAQNPAKAPLIGEPLGANNFIGCSLQIVIFMNGRIKRKELKILIKN